MLFLFSLDGDSKVLGCFCLRCKGKLSCCVFVLYLSTWRHFCLSSDSSLVEVV